MDAKQFLLLTNTMERYRNLGRNSAVYSFEIGIGSIIVQFDTGATYLYNTSTPGASSVMQMQSLAIAGIGLNSYISRYVRKRYARKLR